MPALQGKIAACGRPQTTMSKPDFTPSASALLCPTAKNPPQGIPMATFTYDHIHIRSTDRKDGRLLRADVRGGDLCTKQDGATRIE